MGIPTPVFIKPQEQATLILPQSISLPTTYEEEEDWITQGITIESLSLSWTTKRCRGTFQTATRIASGSKIYPMVGEITRQDSAVLAGLRHTLYQLVCLL